MPTQENAEDTPKEEKHPGIPDKGAGAPAELVDQDLDEVIGGYQPYWQPNNSP